MSALADKLVTDIEDYFEKKYGVDVSSFERDPGGNLGIVRDSGSEFYMDMLDSEDSQLVDLWETITGEKLREQSDEPPSFDDALGAKCDAEQRLEEARQMKG